MQFSFFGALGSILASSGFASFAEDPRSLIMIIIACVLLYMGIGKKFERYTAVLAEIFHGKCLFGVAIFF